MERKVNEKHRNSLEFKMRGKIIKAVKKGNSIKLKELLEDGWNPNFMVEMEGDSRIPLINLAVDEGNEEIVKVLLKHKVRTEGMVEKKVKERNEKKERYKSNLTRKMYQIKGYSRKQPTYKFEPHMGFHKMELVFDQTPLKVKPIFSEKDLLQFAPALFLVRTPGMIEVFYSNKENMNPIFRGITPFDYFLHEPIMRKALVGYGGYPGNIATIPHQIRLLLAYVESTNLERAKIISYLFKNEDYDGMLFISEHIDKPILIMYGMIYNEIIHHIIGEPNSIIEAKGIEIDSYFGMPIIFTNNSRLNPNYAKSCPGISFLIEWYGDNDEVKNSIISPFGRWNIESYVDKFGVDFVDRIPIDVLLYGTSKKNIHGYLYDTGSFKRKYKSLVQRIEERVMRYYQMLELYLSIEGEWGYGGKWE